MIGKGPVGVGGWGFRCFVVMDLRDQKIVVTGANAGVRKFELGAGAMVIWARLAAMLLLTRVDAVPY